MRNQNLKINTFFLVALFNLLTQVQGQSHQPGWHLRLAGGFSQVSEGNISKLISQGAGFAATLGYKFGNEKLQHEIKAQIGASLAKTSFENQYGSVIPDAMLQYTVLKSAKKDAFNWRYGGFLRMHIQDSYYPKLDQGRYYQANFYGLGVHGDVTRSLGTNLNLNVGVELPVAGLISRSPSERYFRIDELSVGNLIRQNFSDLQVGSFDKILNPTITIAVVRKGWLQQLGYEGNFMIVKGKASNDFKRIDHRIFVGIKL